MKQGIKRLTVFLSVAILAFSCASVSNISVDRASNPNALNHAAFIYALPQTVLNVHVVTEEINIIPGPYERYAEKYLGIRHAPSKAEKIYILKGITISRHLEADPDFIYTVDGLSDPAAIPALNNLLKDSLILPASAFAAVKTTAYQWPSAYKDILYTDLSVKRNFEAEKDVEISLVLPDTNYTVPSRSSRTVLKEKTLEQKAEEAANFLIKLKKRRFKLVAGQYDYMPDGESMSAALQELSRIEEEYLSLFIGRRITHEIKKTFHFTPEPDKDVNRTVLFRYSEQKGILNPNDPEGIPVVVETSAMKKIREFGTAKLPVRQPANTLPYRVADQVAIRVLAGEQLWAEAIYPVFQFGSPVSLSLVR